MSKNELIRLVLDLLRRIEALEQEVARLRKNSSTSSKPPSSDIVKPATRGPGVGRESKRGIGGQPGHDKHARDPFASAEVDEVIEYSVDECPDCGGAHANC